MRLKLDKELRVAKKAALEAGKIMMQHYGKVRKLQFKHDKSRVTEVDLMCEKKILSLIKKNFPDHSIHSEEKGDDLQDSDFLWAVDPLDGTTNYSIMMPYFNVSIGLMYKGKPVLGVVYFPINDELFYATDGNGAFLNKKRMRISKTSMIEKSVLGYCYGHSSVKRALKYYSRMRPLCTTRQFGSAALELAYVACGRFDGFYMNDMNSHDVAAGAVLVKEAGGKVTDFKNKQFTVKSIDILATNGRLHNKILKILNKK